MFWQTFFVSFFLNNKRYTKEKLRTVLSSEPFSESKKIFNLTNDTNDYLDRLSGIQNFKHFKSLSGYDLRHNETTNGNYHSIIYNVSNNFYKMNLLEVISNNNISINHKLYLIEQFNCDERETSKYVPNINANYLLNDW